MRFFWRLFLWVCSINFIEGIITAAIKEVKEARRAKTKKDKEREIAQKIKKEKTE